MRERRNCLANAVVAPTIDFVCTPVVTTMATLLATLAIGTARCKVSQGVTDCLSVDSSAAGEIATASQYQT